MIEKATVVIIHGSYGSPNENWFPWLAQEVRMIGHRAIVPSFPTPDGQDLKNWLNLFEIEVGPLRSDMVLVGHSLGPGLILGLLERSQTPIIGTFLVSGFLGELGIDEFDSVNKSFVNRDFDWPAIRENAGKIYVYNSNNDPYVPLEKGRELAERLGTDVHVIDSGGHINAEAGYTEFRQLRDDLRSLLAPVPGR